MGPSEFRDKRLQDAHTLANKHLVSRVERVLRAVEEVASHLVKDRTNGGKPLNCAGGALAVHAQLFSRSAPKLGVPSVASHIARRDPYDVIDCDVGSF